MNSQPQLGNVNCKQAVTEKGQIEQSLDRLNHSMNNTAEIIEKITLAIEYPKPSKGCEPCDPVINRTIAEKIDVAQDGVCFFNDRLSWILQTLQSQLGEERLV